MSVSRLSRVSPDCVLVCCECIFCYLSRSVTPAHARRCVRVRKVHVRGRRGAWKRNERKIETVAAPRRKGTWSPEPDLIRKARRTSLRKGPWVTIRSRGGTHEEGEGLCAGQRSQGQQARRVCGRPAWPVWPERAGVGRRMGTARERTVGQDVAAEPEAGRPLREGVGALEGRWAGEGCRPMWN